MSQKDYFIQLKNDIEKNILAGILLYLVLSQKKDEEIIAKIPIKVGKQTGFSPITIKEEKKRIKQDIISHYEVLKEIESVEKEFLKLNVEKFVERLKEEETRKKIND